MGGSPPPTAVQEQFSDLIAMILALTLTELSSRRGNMILPPNHSSFNACLYEAQSVKRFTTYVENPLIGLASILSSLSGGPWLLALLQPM